MEHCSGAAALPPRAQKPSTCNGAQTLQWANNAVPIQACVVSVFARAQALELQDNRKG